ncbi:hypothetical protein Q6348_05465 [Isoptericola sp. b441]|uniref:Uncharacterized protein n=1 Tax=Actinotalea lenta TaxID=3064654 RepID=A0ABT9D930_9CELL|nr:MULTISPECIES: hypothetical protein [unclassified Isoptericola]MDO8106643.1 hypothetical protein [Isoptericola sp. b441]MDO8121649.1 hypothetical protein [Isoptericola sp. b490]
MPDNRRKSAAIALAVIGVAGLSLASASNLSLSGGTIQAGSTNVSDCQPSASPVGTRLTAGAYDAGAKAFLATSVTLTGINTTATAANPSCVGKQAQAVLLDGSGAVLATSGKVQITASGTVDVAVPSTTSVDAAKVASISAVISDS